MKKILSVIIAIIILVLLFFPYLFIRDIWGDILVKPMTHDVNLKISYIHSVQKTPIEEYLKIERLGKIKLYETHYQSFGVGLPFLEEEGEFHQEGNVYILKMNREFKDLALGVGKDTQLTLKVDDTDLPLYEMLKSGQRVTIAVRPYIIGKFLE